MLAQCRATVCGIGPTQDQPSEHETNGRRWANDVDIEPMLDVGPTLNQCQVNV